MRVSLRLDKVGDIVVWKALSSPDGFIRDGKANYFEQALRQISSVLKDEKVDLCWIRDK